MNTLLAQQIQGRSCNVQWQIKEIDEWEGRYPQMPKCKILITMQNKGESQPKSLMVPAFPNASFSQWSDIVYNSKQFCILTPFLVKNNSQF